MIRITSAPTDYDYSYTKTLEVLPWQTPSGHVYRRVEIDDEHGEYQIGRYNSGLFPAFTEEMFAWGVKDGMFDRVEG